MLGYLASALGGFAAGSLWTSHVYGHSVKEWPGASATAVQRDALLLKAKLHSIGKPKQPVNNQNLNDLTQDQIFKIYNEAYAAAAKTYNAYPTEAPTTDQQ